MRRTKTSAGEPCKFEARAISKRLQHILGCFQSVTSARLNILDIGVGYGAYIERILEFRQPDTYVGIDVVRDHLLITKGELLRGQRLSLFSASAEALPFKDETFDAVLLIEVFEHVRDDAAALKEIYRVMVPGGLMVLTAPNKLFPFETHGFRIGSRVVSTRGVGFPLLPLLPEFLRAYIANARVYTPHRLERVLAKAGFRVVRTDAIGPSLDRLSMNFRSDRIKTLVSQSAKVFDKLEKNPTFKGVMATIVVCCSKRG